MRNGSILLATGCWLEGVRALKMNGSWGLGEVLGTVDVRNGTEPKR